MADVDALNHGTIHGRFHPFHRGHLRLARLARDRCDELTVGITNPDPSSRQKENEDPERHRPENNPMTFWERYRVIRAVLLEDGFDPFGLNIVPFDINHMDDEPWQHYMPPEAKWFIRVKGEWGEAKVQRLESHGLDVVRLPYDRYTEISGTDIRRAIGEGDWTWEDDVPSPVPRLLRSMGVVDRIQSLSSDARNRAN